MKQPKEHDASQRATTGVTNIAKKLRELLIKFECDEGYYEFTDAGVWVTDEAVNEVMSLFTASDFLITEATDLASEHRTCRKLALTSRR